MRDTATARRLLGRWMTVIASLLLTGGVLGSCSSGASQAEPVLTRSLSPHPPATASATPTATTTPTPTPAPPTSTTITPSATPVTASGPCDERIVRTILEDFIAAYNVGDQARLTRLFPTESYPYAPSGPQPGMNQRQFRGYFANHFVTGRLDELREHFIARHAAGERLTLQDFTFRAFDRVSGWELPEMADLAFQVIQEASDITPRTLIGKGVVNCVDGTINFYHMLDDGSGVVADVSFFTGEPVPTLSTPATDPWHSLRRPLDLPWPGPGDTCEPDDTRIVHPSFSAAIGSGPVYALVATRRSDGTVELTEPRSDEPYPVKVVWIAAPEYDGSLLVRGRRIDGFGIVEFSGSWPSDELRLIDPAGSAAHAPDWRIWNGGLLLRSPGCYALQIDGDGFSDVIVIRAEVNRS